jgi:HEPN domain-containing protein
VRNRSLVQDYVRRARNRLAALDVLYERESWADVVRESQEVVELALKAVLRHAGVEVPAIHDVSNILEAEQHRLPAAIRQDVEGLSRISRELRRDRELAFYGSEDLTPSEFYREPDARRARDQARSVVEAVTTALPPGA